MNTLDVYRPAIPQHEGVAVLYPYPFHANARNSARRLQTLANLSGMTIFASDFMGQESGEILNESAKDMLAPDEAFDGTCRQQAEILCDSQYFGYPVRLGMGDSLGATTIVGLQRNRGTIPLFDGVLLRDGFNHRRLQRVRPLATASYIGYWLVDDVIRQTSLSPHGESRINKLGAQSLVAKPTRTPKPHETIKNVGPLMRSDKTVNDLELLARDTQLPMHLVGFKHGLSGKAQRVERFFEELEKSRKNLAEHRPDRTSAPLTTEMAAGWHSDLMHPGLGAKHLQVIRAMVRQ